MRNGFTREAGYFEARLTPAMTEKLAAEVEAADGEGPFPPDTVVFSYSHAGATKDFGERGGPAALRAAQKQILGVLEARPSWTVSVTVNRSGQAASPDKQRVNVQFRNRGAHAVTIDHPAARNGDRTHLVTDVLILSSDGVADSSLRWQSVQPTTAAPPPPVLELPAGTTVQLVLDVRMPNTASHDVHVIYSGRARPAKGEPVRLELDTRYAEPAGLR